jgi:hypothetical protein
MKRKKENQKSKEDIEIIKPQFKNRRQRKEKGNTKYKVMYKKQKTSLLNSRGLPPPPGKV